MTFIVYLLFSIALLFMVSALDSKKLTSVPRPAGNFNLSSGLGGPWYIQARYVPCSFSGSKDFSDIRVEGKMDGNLLKQTVTWRDNWCTTVTFLLDIPQNCKGNFVQRDAIGGMLSGDQVVVVSKPEKGYSITWGCTWKSFDGDCRDPLVLFKTRDRFPKRYIWECAERDLNRLLGLSLKDMVVASHINPC